MCENKPYTLVFGISICDIIGFTNKAFRSHDSNPGRVRVSFGGVCRNIAENMAKVGVNTRFISIVGDDQNGKSLLRHAETVNLDMKDSLIVQGESTPTYMAILNEEGEMEAAIVDMKLADKITEEFVDSKAEIINQSEYMVLGADNPPLIEYILRKYYGKTKFIMDPVSASKAQYLKPMLKYIHTIKPNRQETEVLCGFEVKTMDDVRRAGRHLMELGITNVLISLDQEGIYFYNGVEEGIVKANHVKVVNVTGAGDSCVAGLCYGYMNDLSIRDTLKYSIAMSAITIAHEQTINPDMCHELVMKYIDDIEWTYTDF